MREISLLRNVLIGVPVLFLIATGAVYFWPVPTIQQACMGGDSWCKEESPDHTFLISRAEWPKDREAIEFYASTPPDDLWWRTESFLARGRGLGPRLGPHALIAAAYILSEPPIGGDFLRYSVFGWNVSMTVVNPVPGSEQREVGPYGYFHLVFWRWNR